MALQDALLNDLLIIHLDAPLCRSGCQVLVPNFRTALCLVYDCLITLSVVNKAFA